MPFQITKEIVETRKGPREVVIATPLVAMAVGRDRLELLRASIHASKVDERLVNDVKRVATADSPIMVFRCSGERGSWGLDPELTVREQYELGTLLILSQCANYHAFADAGVALCIHVGLTVDDMRAMKFGSKEAIATLDTSRPWDRLTEWLLRHHVFFFSNEFERFLIHTLPDLVPMLEHRRERLSTLIAHSRNSELE